MIIIWKRKEVFVGYSLQRFNELREMLVSNNIKYEYRIVYHNAGSRRGRTGTFGENMDYANTYYIYVHKRDYDKTCAVLQKLNGITLSK